MTQMVFHKELLIQSGDVSIRKMRDDDGDYRLMSKWLTDKKVFEWVYGRDNPHSLAVVREKNGPRARGEDSVVPFLVYYLESPIGYIQFSPLDEAEGIEYGFTDIEGTYSLDLFIGEVSMWNRGIGTTAVSALVQHLFKTVGASRLTVDPTTTNLRAIRCYEKCGFRKVRVLPKHEPHEGKYRDCWLMIVKSADRSISH